MRTMERTISLLSFPHINCPSCRLKMVHFPRKCWRTLIPVSPCTCHAHLDKETFECTSCELPKHCPLSGCEINGQLLCNSQINTPHPAFEAGLCRLGGAACLSGAGRCAGCRTGQAAGACGRLSRSRLQRPVCLSQQLCRRISLGLPPDTPQIGCRARLSAGGDKPHDPPHSPAAAARTHL